MSFGLDTDQDRHFDSRELKLRLFIYTWIDPEWGTGGSRPSLKIHKNIRFNSNTGPDPLKNHKAIVVSKMHINEAILFFL